MESSLLGAPAAASTGPSTFSRVEAHARAAVTIFGCTVSGGLVAIPKAYQTVGLAPHHEYDCWANSDRLWWRSQCAANALGGLRHMVTWHAK